MSKWIGVFAYDIILSNDDGKVLLFDSEEAALAGLLAEWGKACEDSFAAEECVDANPIGLGFPGVG